MIKILLVDDDEDILINLKLCLKRNDFEVVAISNAVQVIDTALHTMPDIILMDINLDGWDGRVICSHLRNDNHFKIPIVLFSALPEYKSTVASFGANGFINKPFEMKNLVTALHSYLN